MIWGICFNPHLLGEKNYIPKILSKAISYIHISYYWDEFGDRLYQENTET